MPTDYVDIDLAENSALRRELLKGVSEEPADGQDVIYLTDDCGVCPKGLTPQMRDWWQKSIQPARVKAIHELKKSFQEGREEMSGRGIFLAAEVDEIQLHRARRRADLNRKFHNSHAEQAGKLKEARRQYTDLRAAMARDPAPMGWKLYLLGLAIPAVPEFIINIEGLDAIPGVSPLIAFGLAVIIGLMIAASSHIHGEYIKQFDYHFGPQDGNHAFKALRMIGIGGMMLLLSLVLVGYSRYQLILPEIMAAVLRGQEPPSIIAASSMTLCGNLLVYGWGVFWSFRYHDEQPDYKEISDKYHKLEATYTTLYRREVAQELARIDRDTRQKTDHLARVDTEQSNRPAYTSSKEKVARFLAQDARVKAVLGEAKSDIVRRANARNIRFVINDWDDRANLTEHIMNSAEFVGFEIKLKIVEGEHG